MRSKQCLIQIPQILEPLYHQNILDDIQNSPSKRKSSDFFKKVQVSQIQTSIYDNLEYIAQEIQNIQKSIFKYGKKILIMDGLLCEHEKEIRQIINQQEIQKAQVTKIAQQRIQAQILIEKKKRSYFDDYLSSDEDDLQLYK
ncbi:Hypothetical_protein [Hexamita inflata]|uniref:Hypothetical_protein n=1 Tax=Hexamita inflata TaxID=28002 RepID=A0AA86UWX0_9EUKA|nr:Hypothetical protein HINF_LOCUS39213 [Hexamita inflata]